MAISAFTTPSELKLQDFYVGLPYEELKYLGEQKQKRYDEFQSSYDATENALKSIKPATGSKDEKWYYEEFMPKVKQIRDKYASADMGDAMVQRQLKNDIATIADTRRLTSIQDTGKQYQAAIEEYNKNPEKYNAQLTDFNKFKDYDSSISGAFNPAKNPVLAVNLDDKPLVDKFLTKIEETTLDGGYSNGVNRAKVNQVVAENVASYLSDPSGRQKVQLYKMNTPGANTMSDEQVATEILRGYAERQIGKKLDVQFMKLMDEREERAAKAKQEHEDKMSSDPYYNYVSELKNKSIAIDTAKKTMISAQRAYDAVVNSGNTQYIKQAKADLDKATNDYSVLASAGVNKYNTSTAFESFPINVNNKIEGTDLHKLPASKLISTFGNVDPVISEKIADYQQFQSEYDVANTKQKEYNDLQTQIHNIEQKIKVYANDVIARRPLEYELVRIKTERDHLNQEMRTTKDPGIRKIVSSHRSKWRQKYGEDIDLSKPDARQKIADEYNIKYGRPIGTPLKFDGDEVKIKGDVVYKYNPELASNVVDGKHFAGVEAFVRPDQFDGDTEPDVLVEKGLYRKATTAEKEEYKKGDPSFDTSGDLYVGTANIPSQMDDAAAGVIFTGHFMKNSNMTFTGAQGEILNNQYSVGTQYQPTQEESDSSFLHKNYLNK